MGYIMTKVMKQLMLFADYCQIELQSLGKIYFHELLNMSSSIQ